VLTTLAHHIDLAWLGEAYRRTRKDGAPGIDGQTARQYEENLAGNLISLLNRAKTGEYFAPPVRRVHIPKGKADKRPIGIPTFEDKVLQRAVAMVLEAVYEQDFMDSSYGFRPKRTAHQALESFRSELMEMRGGWVVEIDIRKFFDRVDRKRLGAILRQRVGDGVLLRLIGKWLHAGVQHDGGSISYPEAGTPQGGVISPILANIFLHEVLDTWFEEVVKPRLRGRAAYVRYADDCVMAFSEEKDARRVLAVLAKRVARFGLALHPDKTRLVCFQRPRSGKLREGQSGSFDYLGFTHYWGQSRRGNWVVKQKTAKDRLARAVERIHAWCRAVRHRKLREQHRALAQKLIGHYGYYGITSNFRALSAFREAVKRAWKMWLGRRSQRRHVSWQRFARIQHHYPLPRPRIVHSYVT